MFFIFLSYVFSVQRPLFAIHGFGGVQTNATTTTQIDKCPNGVREVKVWAPDSEMNLTHPDCIAYFLEANIDSNNKITQNPNFQFSVPPFGSFDTINSFRELKPYFTDRGYSQGRDLFAVIYNWTLYPFATEGIFEELKQSIEKAHKESGQKAVIIAHSLGTHFMRNFLTRQMTPEWVQEHIDGAILCAPAFLGCYVPFSSMVTGRFSSLTRTDYTAIVSRKMPSIHAMFDNYVAFKDTVVFHNVSNFGDVTAPNVKDFLVSKGMMNEEAQKIFALVEDFLKEDPVQLPVRSLVLYNSAIETLAGYTGDNFEPVYGRGDGACQSSAPDYICGRWQNAQCIDFNVNDPNWGHTPMFHQTRALEAIYNFVTEEAKDEKKKNDDVLLYVLIGMCIVAFVLIIVLIVSCCIIRRR